MEYFHSGGGGPPYFLHRIKVLKCTEEMYDWCDSFDSEGKSFCRWHVEWSNSTRYYEIVQFEWEAAAIIFKLKFGCI